MTNILLVCSMGLSTNMMAEAMEKSAKKQGIDVTIWAVPESKAPENADKADVILLGPQLSFKLDSMKKQYAGKPMACIEMRSYGMMDGAAALKQAMDLL
jgi:PTS system cellobiose-specific IIB component